MRVAEATASPARTIFAMARLQTVSTSETAQRVTMVFSATVRIPAQMVSVVRTPAIHASGLTATITARRAVAKRAKRVRHLIPTAVLAMTEMLVRQTTLAILGVASVP